MTEVFIGIGSNLGNKKKNIEEAVDSLENVLISMSVSDFYRTYPRDYLDQDSFENIVVRGFTPLSAEDLLLETQRIETEGGRIRDKTIPKGPRMIDLDILLFGKDVIDREDLSIPHKAVHERRFVLIPLLELNPEIIDPSTGNPYYLSMKKTEEQGVYCSSLNHYNDCFI